MTREEFEAAWKRWDADGNGTHERSEVRSHTVKNAALIGDPAMADAEVLYPFALTFYYGLANPSAGMNHKLDKDWFWQMLNAATSQV